MSHHFNASRGGHAPGHLRGFFIALVLVSIDCISADEAAGEVESFWPNRLPIGRDPLAWICGQLHNCTDQLTWEFVSELEDSGIRLRDRRYAAAARVVLSKLSDPDSEFSHDLARRGAICDAVRPRSS
jgi:hypothetical protein